MAGISAFLIILARNPSFHNIYANRPSPLSPKRLLSSIFSFKTQCYYLPDWIPSSQSLPKAVQQDIVFHGRTKRSLITSGGAAHISSARCLSRRLARWTPADTAAVDRVNHLENKSFGRVVKVVLKCLNNNNNRESEGEMVIISTRTQCLYRIASN